MELATMVAIVLIGILIGVIAYLMVWNIIASQYIAWASSIRSWYPPMYNNTLECPQGYIITSTNASGVYICGPCMAYLAPNGALAISCPR
mgnify:CR=1 FL=1